MLWLWVCYWFSSLCSLGLQPHYPWQDRGEEDRAESTVAFNFRRSKEKKQLKLSLNDLLFDLTLDFPIVTKSIAARQAGPNWKRLLAFHAEWRRVRASGLSDVFLTLSGSGTPHSLSSPLEPVGLIAGQITGGKGTDLVWCMCMCI